MPKMLAFIDGSIYSDSVCDHIIWAGAGDQFEVSLFNVIEGTHNADAPSNLSGNLGAEAKNKLLIELSELDQKRSKADGLATDHKKIKYLQIKEI